MNRECEMQFPGKSRPNSFGDRKHASFRVRRYTLEDALHDFRVKRNSTPKFEQVPTLWERTKRFFTRRFGGKR